VIAVDASAVAAFVLKEEGWEALRGYLTRCISADHVIKEVANAIWRHAVVRGLMSLEEARQAYRILSMLAGTNIELHPQGELMDEAFEIALRRRVTVYDALYIALAKRRGTPLLTLDRKQAKAAQKEGVEVVVQRSPPTEAFREF
jgi:predicted nucleic acid-binding protein